MNERVVVVVACLSSSRTNSDFVQEEVEGIVPLFRAVCVGAQGLWGRRPQAESFLVSILVKISECDFGCWQLQRQCDENNFCWTALSWCGGSVIEC